MGINLRELHSSDFAVYLGQTFRIHIPSFDPIDVELSKVTELGSPAQAETRQPFSIIFLGPPSNQYLAQSMYPLEHPQMGKLELFLVPLGPTAEGRMRYEAIFA